MKKITIKEVINSDGWIITKVTQGYNGLVRVDAKRRFPIANQSSFFSEWGNIRYINRLYMEKHDRKININY